MLIEHSKKLCVVLILQKLKAAEKDGSVCCAAMFSDYRILCISHKGNMKQWDLRSFVCYNVSYISFTVSAFMLWPSSECLIFTTKQVVM